MSPALTYEFTGDNSLHEHVVAERGLYIERGTREAYTSARLRGRLLDHAIFDRLTSAQLATVRWADVGETVRHVAGARK